MGYLDNAVATTKGWTHPKTGELLKSQRMSQQEADAHNGIAHIVEEVEEQSTEDKPSYEEVKKDLGEMIEKSLKTSDKKTKEDFIEADLVEIGNTVFMLFEKKDGKVVGELKQQNVLVNYALLQVCKH